MNEIQSMYGYKIGDVVETLVDIYDEHAQLIPPNTRIRLIYIVPKVFIRRPESRLSRYEDGKAYFFNAVRADEVDYWDKSRKNGSPYGRRIRANFCTIKKSR